LANVACQTSGKSLEEIDLLFAKEEVKQRFLAENQVEFSVEEGKRNSAVMVESA
jgi:hypothetical protein